MGTTAASVLEERLCKAIGDWLEVALTTAATASVAVVSTNLRTYDDGEDDHYNGWWVYHTDGANAGVDRKIYDYATAAGSASVRGASYAAETSLSTVRVSRHGYTAHLRAINDAIREIGSDVLFRPIEDRSIVTNNILWDGHMENFTSSTAMTFWTANSATIAKSSTAGLYRGARGTFATKITGVITNDYIYQSSSTNPNLLDLKDSDVSLYVWAYSETANDGKITAYTVNSAGSTQTLASTTTCSSAKWTLLKLENQKFNDDLTSVEIRLGVASSTKYVIYDNARVTGRYIKNYMLPETLVDGDISQVYIQRTGDSDYPCDDIMPREWDRIFNWDVISDGTYKFLYLPYTYSTDRQLKLIGTSPLTELTESGTASFASSTEISGNAIDLLTAYATYCLLRNEEGVPSADDTARYISRAQRGLNEYNRLLPSLRMIKPRGTMHIPEL